MCNYAYCIEQMVGFGNRQYVIEVMMRLRLYQISNELLQFYKW